MTKLRTIHNFWTTQIISDASSKSTLKYLAIQNYRVGVTHNIWTDASVDTQAVKKAGVKARLTTGTYMLQTSRAKFSKQGVSPVCQLCHTGDEDIAHFLLSCTSLVRSHFMSKLTSILCKHNLDTCYHDNDDLLVQTLLDCTDSSVPIVLQSPEMLHEIESLARGLCFSLHCQRSQILGMPMY